MTEPFSPARIAVIGCGYWGRNLVRNFAALGSLAAVCDANEASARDFADKFGAKALSWAEVLADCTIKGVAIAAPAELHHQLATEALEAGKDVFVEKPVALAVADAEALCRLADSRGRILMVGHLLQYHPAFLALKDLVVQGGLGRLRYVYSTRLNLGKIRREENILWSFAPHDLSMILGLVGEEPHEVTATGAAYLHERIADVTTTHFAFPGGVRGHVFVSWLHPFKEQKLVVVGDEGMAVFDDGQPWESKVQVWRHRIEWKDGMPQPVKADAEPMTLTQDEPLKLECAHFLDCIATRATPRTDGKEGLRVLKVLARAQAAIEGRPEPVEKPAMAPGVFVHDSAVVDAGVIIGAGSKIWHFSHVLGQVSIGKGCVVGQNVTIGPHVTIGDGVKIQNNVSVYKGVTLEDDVFCGPSCVFTNVLTPRAFVERKNEFAATVVRRGATIGANSTIVCGNTIGRYAMVGAGAVVTRDVPDFALVVGNPARPMGWVSRSGERLGDDLVCPRTGECYRIGPNGLEALDE